MEEQKLFDKAMECPCCKYEFTTKKVRMSRLRILKRDEDFLEYYNDGIHPLKYNVFVCPKCGYSALESKFLDISPEEIKIIKEHISPKWVTRDYGRVRTFEQAIETQKLALLQGNILKSSRLEIGNHCLNIGWLCRIIENSNEEARFITLARDQFIETYNNDYLLGTNMDESKLTYLIGELSRRIGDKSDALSWFNICLNLDTTKSNQALENMAREQWRLIREEAGKSDK